MAVHLLSNDHQFLGMKYCTGYQDSNGKWNNGFDCPTLERGEPSFCCGTPSYRYCCTKKEENNAPIIDNRSTILLGIALGTLLVVALLTIAVCLFCRRCHLYKNRHQSMNGGPLYRMHCSSTASGVANMYSFSGQNSSATTPMDGAEPHLLAEISCHQGTPRVPSFSSDGILTRCPAGVVHFSGHVPPMEPPPPYQANSSHSTLLVGTGSPSTTSFTQGIQNHPRHSEQRKHQNLHQSSQPRTQQTPASIRDPVYWSTKF